MPSPNNQLISKTLTSSEWGTILSALRGHSETGIYLANKIDLSSCEEPAYSGIDSDLERLKEENLLLERHLKEKEDKILALRQKLQSVVNQTV